MTESVPAAAFTGRYRFFYFSALAILLAFLILYFMPAVNRFLIAECKTGRVLYLSSVKPGDVFSITYLHSVNKSPVEDRFQIGEDYSIILRKSIFKSFGAGVPSSPADGGRFEFFKDRLEVADIDRTIGTLLLFTGTEADHHLVMNEKIIKFNELAVPQSSVRLYAAKITVYQYLKYYIKSGRN